MAEKQHTTLAYIMTDCMDLDGLFSAVILNRALKTEQTKIVNLPTRVVDLAKRYTELFTQNEPGRVVVADLAHNSSINSLESLFCDATQRGFSIEVYDEHAFQVNELIAQQFDIILIRDGKAAAKIVQEAFAPHDTVSKHYADLAQLADYPPPQPHALDSLLDDLSDLILGVQHVKTDVTFESLIAHYAQEQPLWTQEFQTICSAYRSIQRNARFETRASIETYLLRKSNDDVKLAIGYASQILYMKPGIELVHTAANTPLAIVVFDDGKVVFSARHSRAPDNAALAAVDCSKLGIAYGGGGRYDGGGGNVPGGNVQKHAFSGIAFDLKEKVKALFQLSE